VDDSTRHAEVIGELRGLGQKIDSHIANSDKVHGRQDSAISGNTKDINKLKDFQSRTKGVGVAAVAFGTVLAAIGGVVAWAKEIF